jgi:hypothetical protein
VARPTRTQSLRRKAEFLHLIADGADVVEARKTARIDPDAALRIVAESDFRDLVALLREGTIPHATVVTAPVRAEAA